MDEITRIYEMHSLTDEPGMIPAATSAFSMARVVIYGFPDYFLSPKVVPQEIQGIRENPEGTDLSCQLIEENAKALIRSVLRPCEIALLASKSDSNKALVSLEREHAVKFVHAFQEMSESTPIHDKEIIELTRLKDKSAGLRDATQFEKIVMQAMREQKSDEMDHPRIKGQKVTQHNVAKRLGMKRTTLESKLADHAHPLKWKALKEKIDEEFRQNS